MCSVLIRTFHMHIEKKVHFHNFSICEALNMALKMSAKETSPAFSIILVEIFFLLSHGFGDFYRTEILLAL